MRKIKGYNPLSDEQIFIINALKSKFSELEEMLGDLENVNDFDIDKRSVSIAVTNLQTASMWAVRSIAQPE